MSTEIPSESVPFISRFLYGAVRLLFTLLFRGLFRTRMTGRDRIPGSGGLLVICNHISFADPPMLAVAIPRPVEFMTMVEIFRKPLLGWIARTLRAFPVDRSRADHGAAREAIRRLRHGRCVAIFPEAGIRLEKQSVLGGDPVFKPGAGTIALLGGAAILPVVVRDTRKPYQWRNWFRQETMSVTVGPAFSLWVPYSLHGEERRRVARETLRERLLQTALEI